MKETTYIETDAFAKHLVKFCQDYCTSNTIRARLTETVGPTIIWYTWYWMCSAGTKNSKIPSTLYVELYQRDFRSNVFLHPTDL